MYTAALRGSGFAVPLHRFEFETAYAAPTELGILRAYFYKYGAPLELGRAAIRAVANGKS